MTTRTRPRRQGVRGRHRRTSAQRAWLLAWFGLAVIAVLNGTIRRGVYADWVGELRAHQLSTALLIALTAGYAWLLQRRWPLPSTRIALGVGAAWTAFTLLFELGFGHYVAGNSWTTLLADYDLTEGRVWVFVPLWLFVAPELIRRWTVNRR